MKRVKLYAKLLEQEDIMLIAATYWNAVEDILNGISNKMYYK